MEWLQLLKFLSEESARATAEQNREMIVELAKGLTTIFILLFALIVFIAIVNGVQMWLFEKKLKKIKKRLDKRLKSE